MVWNNAEEFFYMGGYGLYVWGSVTVTFGFMLAEVLLLKLRRRAAIQSSQRAMDVEAGISDEGEDFRRRNGASE